MRVSGFAAEYNPFTNGHLYHLKQCNGAKIAVMSGNFVQRGEAAFFDKFTRARLAVDNGADLVIGLPVPFSVASAEKFAYGAVFLLNALGVCDNLCFGSECADTNALSQSASAALLLTKEKLEPFLSQGMSFASARAAVLKNEGVFVPEKPNDILAVEYIKALKKLKSHIIPQSVLRKADYHGDGSASQARKLLFEGDDGAARLLPENVYEEYLNLKNIGRAPASLKNAERAIFACLRSMTPQEIGRMQGISEGLEFKLAEAAAKATSLEELYEKIKSKRYAMSAVRRAVLCAFLKIEKNDSDPTYIHVLAQNNKGSEILRAAKKTATLPIVHSLSALQHTDRFAAMEVFSSDIYALCLPEIRPSGAELTEKKYIKNI